MIDMKLGEVEPGLGEGCGLGHRFSQKVGDKTEVLGYHFFYSLLLMLSYHRGPLPFVFAYAG